MKKYITKYPVNWLWRELRTAHNKLARNKDIMFINELFDNKKYSINTLYDFVKKYKDEKKCSELYKLIKQKLETRAVQMGLGFGENRTNKTNAAFLIFFMKNAYGWQDKTEATHNITLPTPILVGLKIKGDTPAIEAGQEFEKQDFKKFVQNNKAEYVEAEEVEATTTDPVEVAK